MQVKKLLFGLGGIAVLSAPMISVVSCGSTSTNQAPEISEAIRDGITVNKEGYITKFNKNEYQHPTNLEIFKSITINGNEVKVIGINDGVFQNQGFTKLTINADLQIIGKNAFSGNQFSSIELPSTLKTIDDGAFKGNVIRSISFKETKISEDSTGKVVETVTNATKYDLTKIGNEAFVGNEIESLTLLENKDVNLTTSIGDRAFEGNKISSLSLGKSVSTIGDWAFSKNKISGEVIFGNNVTSIGDESFLGNTIDKITLGNKVQTIGHSAFANNLIKSLDIPYSVKTIRFGAFANNQISQLNLTTGLEKIAAAAFINNKITTLTIPSTIKTISDNAFANNSIEQLKFAENSVLKMIGDQAFYNNAIVSNIELPDSLMYIGEESFARNKFTSAIVPNATAYEQNSFDSNVTINKKAPIIDTPENQQK